MLSFLKIRNLALVEDVTWELAAGLIGVTGETGAGKSIIVGALKLVLGERADRDLIRSIGLGPWEKMTEPERRAQTQDREKHYWEEFTKNGIERVALERQP